MTSRTEGISLLSMYNDEEEEEEEEELERRRRQIEEEGEEAEEEARRQIEEEEGGRQIEEEEEEEGEGRRQIEEEQEEEEGEGRRQIEEEQEAEEERRRQIEEAEGEEEGDGSQMQMTPPHADAEWSHKPDSSSPMDLLEPSLPSLSPLSSLPFPIGGHRRQADTARAIVDYAHDDNAPSPGPEDGEMVADLDMLDADLQDTDGSYDEDRFSPGAVKAHTPARPIHQSHEGQLLETMKFESVTAACATGKGTDASLEDQITDISVETHDNRDHLLKTFLPSPPDAHCSQELQEKINKFLALKKAGKSFNTELRNMKAYRNPDFLLHAVRYQEINQVGTCFRKDIFDPEGYDKSDYYDEIEADMKHELERKEQERKRSPKVEFVPGGAQLGMVASVSRINTQFPVSSAGVVSSAQATVSASADGLGKENRQTKKSKWDKVDINQKNPLQAGGSTITSTASIHSSIVTDASNIGTGYSAFVQQKRKEAEEKQSSERNYDRIS